MDFLYPLKTSENRKVFWSFQGVEKGCIENEWVKLIIKVPKWSPLKKFDINRKSTRIFS